MRKISYKEFSQYLKGKSFNQTLHQARLESLERIMANEEEIKVVLGTSKKVATSSK